MRVVLDTSAIIYLSDFRKFKQIFTVEEVIKEVKDKISKLKLSSLNFKIVSPSLGAVEEIKKIAKETGDFEKLSQTDIKVLALAKENNLIIVSDDRNIQNVAEKVGMKCISVFTKKIVKLITWKKFCKNCKKYYNKGIFCKVCGQRLTRIIEKEKVL